MKSGKVVFIFILVCFLILPACQIIEDPVDDGQSPAAGASVTADPLDQTKLWENWQRSPHANTYDIHKGPNTYCSQCHSPRNWDPQAVIDPPPNCVSCKFQFEDEPRIAAGNPLVPREQWTDIRCDICHEVNEGLADPQLVWWDQAGGKYESVADANAQCEKCHTDTETILHRRDLGDATHLDFQCTDCHDAHSAAASCSDAGCHADLSVENHGDKSDTAVNGADHTAVSCAACHDFSGLEVGLLDDEGQWVTWRTTELMERINTKPYQSHAIGLEVNCERCHFTGNPWNLDLLEGQEDPIN